MLTRKLCTTSGTAPNSETPSAHATTYLSAAVRERWELPLAPVHQHGENALQTLRERVLQHEQRVRDLQSAPPLWPVPLGANTQQAETGGPIN